MRIYNGARTPECFLELAGFPKHPEQAEIKEGSAKKFKVQCDTVLHRNDTDFEL